MPRLFVAIDLPEPIRQQLINLKKALPGARWVKPAQMHLTLRFIGEVEEMQAEQIAAALSTILAASFDLVLEGVGYFPPRGKPRVLWVGIQQNPRLEQLYDAVSTALLSCGLEPEARGFSPHITLARLNDPPVSEVKQFVENNRSFRTESLATQEFYLHASTLDPQGAIYRKLATFPLQARDFNP